MQKRMRRKLGKVRAVLLGFFILGSVAFVVFAVASERRREAAVASIVLSPEVAFHHRLSEALEAPEVTPPPELQPALDSIQRWRSLFQRKASGLDGDEWDALENLWTKVDSWDALSPEVQERFATFFEAHEDFFEEVRRVAATGGPMEAVPQPPTTLDMKHVMESRYTARLVRLNTIYRAHNGDKARAFANCIASMQIASALGAEPELMAQLGRFGCSLIAHSTIVDAFPPGVLSRAETSQLINQAQQVDSRMALVTALSHSQVSLTSELSAMAEMNWPERYERMKLGAFVSNSSLINRAGTFAYSSPLGRPWLDQDITRMSAWLARVVDVAPYPYYEAVERFQDPVDGFAPYAESMVSATYRSLADQARHEAMQQLLQIGLTVELYQVTNGTFPDALEALSAELPDSVFVDPFTGEPLHYRVEGDSFTLYSAGRNQEDDGGRHDFPSGDIVWRGED